MGLKLRAKVLPKYFKEIQDGDKDVEYRQFDTITFVNTETNEEISRELSYLLRLSPAEAELIRQRHPDVPWDKKEIYALGIKRPVDCPDCAGQLEFKEGCRICPSCGFSVCG